MLIMDKNSLIELTKNLYRLTLLFPKKEPLRYKIKEVADDILANFIRNSHQSEQNQSQFYTAKILEDLDVLDSFFSVAKDQNWVKPADINLLQEKYNELKNFFEKQELKLKLNHQTPILLGPEKEEKKEILKKPVPTQPSFVKLNERHEKILAFLKENKKVQVWQIKEILPQVTKRTLRRDFHFLVKNGIIERIGERNNTFYQLKNSQ